MLDNLKALMQGWKDKGAFPNVPPDLAKPYVDAVVSYYEDIGQRLSLRMAVCDKDEETIAFEFSYDVLPLSMAAAMGHIRNDGKEDRYRFIDKALSAITGPLGRNKPTYEVGQVLREESEVARLHQVVRLAGAVCSISGFVRTPMPYAALLDLVYPGRSVEFMKNMIGAADAASSKEQVVVAFTRQSARQFLGASTCCPDVEKAAEVAQHIARFYFALCDIPNR